ncbi:fatty acid desaturase family protein [Marinigracilibium pacificum]|uniref:Acyl-CoA desaturase n=1 Tax=Marinigracilibium pacificum TaxID=2729599 RepID=A0A848J230_9BACT|nr:acyl-CoA desaturase [Marinigracilibium pacificum]NMM50883.1 acyl-CoA desaturase [Marinigracilibium pacificum]
MIRYKFSRTLNKEFSAEIKQRVNEYFKKNQIRKTGGGTALFKAFFALSVYLIPFVLILSGVIQSTPLMFLLWMLMGAGMAFIGTSVMHDALHGSLSNNKLINKLLGLTAPLMGVDGKLWQYQHNVLHHTYTNIEHADEDIQPRYVLRFTPNQPRRWFHRYQHLYAPILYSISTIQWVAVKDFIKVFTYKKKELIKSNKEVVTRLTKVAIGKAFYIGIFLVLPIVVLNQPVWLTISMFVVMHMVAGVLLSLIFQPAHVVPTSDFIMQDEQLIQENWSVHQILTTSNFAMRNKVLSYFIGGLNFQVEHHLFPNICHIHYPEISKIIQKTTEKYKLPYFYEKSFRSALKSHFKLLKTLGRQDELKIDYELRMAA